MEEISKKTWPDEYSQYLTELGEFIKRYKFEDAQSTIELMIKIHDKKG